MKSTMYSTSPASSGDQELYVCTVKDDVNLETVLLPPLFLTVMLTHEVAVEMQPGEAGTRQVISKCGFLLTLLPLSSW